MSDGINVTTFELLRTAYTSPMGGIEGAENDGAYTAQLALYARTQYAFYAAFQTVVLVLAFATLGALVVFVMRLISGLDVAVSVVGLGTLVSGGAAGFLQKQVGYAKDRYMEALKLWKAS